MSFGREKLLRTLALVGLLVAGSLGISVQPAGAAGPDEDSRPDSQSADRGVSAAFAARASISPGGVIAGDPAATLFTLTVHNTGISTAIGAVLVARPSSAWAVAGCPGAPAGWQASGTALYCEYRATTAVAAYIPPGATSSGFHFRARADAAGGNASGSWAVFVGSTNASLTSAINGEEGDFQSDSGDLRAGAGARRLAPALVRATPEGPGLAPTAHVLEITAVGVATAGLTPGAACPATGLGTTALAGSNQTIAVCGRNHSRVELRPTARQSTLGGSFISHPGNFTSARIAPGGGDVVLGKWTGAALVPVPATGLTLTATLGAGSRSSARPFTAGGFTAAEIPVARDDAYSMLWNGTLSVPAPGVLGNDARIGSAISGYGALTGQEQTTIGSATPTSAGGIVTLAADGSFTYSPPAGFAGEDRFKYVLTNALGTSTGAVLIRVVAPPTTAADHYAIAQNTPRTVGAPGLLANDQLRGATLQSYTQPGHGTVLVNPDGSFAYSPTLGFSGSDSFTYTVANPGGSSTATVSLGVFAPVVTVVSPPPGDTFYRAPGVVFRGDRVQVSACPVCDSPDPQLGFRWQLSPPPGSRATLDSLAGPSPSFVADIVGTYVLSATVSDSGGSVSLSALSLATGNCGSNPVLAFILVSAPDGTRAFDPRTLSAGASSADDSASCPQRFAPTYAYQWSVISAPAAFTLSSDSGPAVQFTAHDSGTYVVRLQVTASSGQTATVSIEQSAACAAAPTVSASAAGVAQVNVGDRVQPAASATSGCISAPVFRYAWRMTSRPAGSSASISDPSSAAPTFVPDIAGGSYALEVVATDQYGHASAPAAVSFSTTTCGSNPVIAMIGDSGVARDFDPRTLTASVSDADADPLRCPARFAPTYSYRWSVVSPPTGFTLSDTSAPAVQFAANQDGTFVVRLTVTASSGQAASAERVITTTCNPTPALSATAGGSSAYLGDALALSAIASSSACWSVAPAYSYSWSVTARPAGSAALLSNPSAANPGFVPDVPGDYGFRVVVTDAFGHASDPASTSIRIVLRPQTPVISAPAVVTAGRTYTASLVARPGMTYTWTITNGTFLDPVSGLLGGGIDSIRFVPNSPGAMVLSAVETDGAGTSSAAGVASLSVFPAPATPNIVGFPVRMTVGDSLALSLAPPAPNPGMTYRWSASVDGGAAVLGSGPTFNPVVGAGSSLVVSVTESNAAGDSSAAEVVTGAIFPAPVSATIGGLPARGLTVGAPVTLGVADRSTGVSPYAYTWSVGPSSSGTGTFSPASGPTTIFTPTGAGTVQISVTETNGAGASATGSASSLVYGPRL